MREDLTFIAVILDRSGSMQGVRADTIGGFNAFLEEQKNGPGEALLTLVQFDDEYEVHADAMPIKSVEPLTELTYAPRGNTALLGAIGRTIDAVGAKLRAMPEEARPGRVLIMIQTDGQENHSAYNSWSREYTPERVTRMINHQREKYSWNFSFVGANEKAITAAVSWGIQENWTRQYAATPAGTANVLRGMSVGTSNYRGMTTNEVNLAAADDSFSFFEPDPNASTPDQ